MFSYPVKFNKKKRIKVSYFRLCDVYKVSYWDMKIKIADMELDFGMRLTSRRVGVLYFQIVDPVKYTIFLLQYPETLIRG